jgi:cation transport regulator ChaC
MTSNYEFSDADRDEMADVAADVAYDKGSEHEKLSELENRLEALEARLGM